MSPDEMQAYITLLSTFYTIGVAVVGKVKDLIGLFHPDVVLTDDQINAIELAGVADSKAKAAQRAAMAVAS